MIKNFIFGSKCFQKNACFLPIFQITFVTNLFSVRKNFQKMFHGKKKSDIFTLKLKQ